MFIIAGIIVISAFRQENLYLPIFISEHVPYQALFSWGSWTFRLNGIGVFGWMMGLSGLIFVLFVIPVTKWFKNISDQKMLIVSTGLFGFGLLLMAFTTNAWILFLLMAVMSFGELMQSPVSDSFVSKYAPSDKRGQYMGAATLQNSIANFFAPMTIVMSGYMSAVAVLSIVLVGTLVSCALYKLLFQILSDKNRTNGTTSQSHD